MATYHVTAPDGSVHEITAPDSATPEEIRAYAERTLGYPKHSGQGVVNSLHGAASSFLDGALPGAGGVASGLLDMAGNALAAPFSSSVDFDPAGSFRSGREASEQHEERFKKDHPYLGAASTAAGFLGGFALPVTKAGLGVEGVQAALRSRILNSAANGAIYGGAGGLLDSHADSVGGAAMDAVRGALSSASVAGALPVVGRLAAPITQPIANAVGRVAAPAIDKLAKLVPPDLARKFQNRAAILGGNPADVTASRYIGRQMDKGGVDSAALMAELKRRQGLGVPAVPADVNEHLREAYGSATRRPGPATMAVRQRIDERQRQMSARVSQHVEAALGSTTNVAHQADLLNRQARNDAQPLYAVSNAQPIPFTRELQTLFAHPDARDALNIAGKQIWADAIRNGHPDPRGAVLEHGLVENPDGTFGIATVPPMALYDHAKTAFDNVIYSSGRHGAAPETDRAAKATRDLRGRLLEIMDGTDEVPGLNPHWRAAREAWSGPTQNRKALELGQDMVRADATDAANRMEGLTGSQTDHFRLGHRSEMAATARKVPDYGNAARNINGALEKRRAIETIHGTDKAEDLFDRLKAEHEGNQTWAAVRGNSMTAGADAADKIGQQERALGAAGKGLVSAVLGQPISAVRHVVSALADQPVRTAAVDDRVSSVLGAQDLAAVREALADVRRTRAADKATAARITARGQQTAKVLGSRTGAGIATPPAGQVLLGYGSDSDGSQYPMYGEPGTDLGPDYRSPHPNR